MIREANSTEKPKSHLPIAGYYLVRVMVGALLIVAAVLKGVQLATEPVPNESLLTYRWSMLVQVELELLLGLWLAAGLWRRLTWAATTLCFVGFAAVTGYRAITGETSCGCFGPVEVDPWYTLALDLAVIAALLANRPRRRPVPRPWARAVTVAAVWVIIGAAAVVGSARYEPATIDEAGRIIGDDPFVVLRPSEWVGGRFPLLDHIDVGARLAKGDWLVILVHDHCRDCRDALGRYRQLAEVASADREKAMVAIIELPPFVEPEKSFFAELVVVRGRISAEREWFLRTPRELVVVDGKVQSVDEQEELPPALRRGPGKAITITHDAGKVRMGATIEHTFKIENTSDRIWRTEGILADCACADAPTTLEPIAPGELREVPLKVIADAPGEAFQAQLVVQMALAAPIRLVIKANSIDQVPPSIVFGNVKLTEPASRRIAIRSATDEPITVTKVEHDEALLDVRWERDPAHPNDVAMDVALRDGLQPGRMVTKMQVHTDDPVAPVHRVVVEANLLAPVVASPDLLGFGRVRTGERRTAILRLRSPYGHALKLQRVEASDDAIKCDAANAVQTGGEIHLPVTVVGGGVTQRYLHGSLTVHLDMDGEPYSLSVRVMAASDVKK